MSKVLSTEQYLRLVIHIDDVLTVNLPELFEKKEPGWGKERRR
ncbi:hypothetical protein ACFLWR_02205 [Chloroflexota bacterium]